MNAEILATCERAREAYAEKRDPIHDDRLLWRTQSFRHLMHIRPGARILEIGCGGGKLTRHLARVTRNECSITAVTFLAGSGGPQDLPPGVHLIHAAEFPGDLAGQEFDHIIALDMLDARTSTPLLRTVFDLLAPGGQILLYQSNPWNVFLRARRFLGKLVGWRDPRMLLSRMRLYELMSEVGFIHILATYNDFVYAPLTRHMVWALRNLSIILENTPGIRNLAGVILVYGLRPPARVHASTAMIIAPPGLKRAVSFVIPCHNEEMNIAPLVNAIRGLFDDFIHEIVLVDDNSRDDTRSVIQRLASGDARIKPLYRLPPNGVGRAIQDGLRAASGKYVISMDCDFQHLLPEVRDLFDTAAKGADVVVGSRFSRRSVLLNYPFSKIVANRAFHALARLFLWARIRDLTNNLKLMRREVVDNLLLQEPGFAVNAETGFQPLILGYRVVEVPISWIGRSIDMGTSSFSLVRVSGGYWRVLFQLLLARWLKRGSYAPLLRRVDRAPRTRASVSLGTERL